MQVTFVQCVLRLIGEKLLKNQMLLTGIDGLKRAHMSK
jgi:hypothetical protein